MIRCVRAHLELLLAIAISLTPPTTAFATTFTVTSLGDSGDDNPGDGFALDYGNNTTLRAAIEEANALSGSDTIIFDNSLAGQTIYLSNGQMLISANTTINGFANNPVVLDGLYNIYGERAFEIDTGVTVTISGIKFIFMYGYVNGAAIYNDGILTVDACVFDNCFGFYGGAIYSGYDQAGTAVDLDCQDSTFDACYAGMSGGAVYLADGVAVFDACEFGLNARCHCDVQGGALFTANGSVATISSCEFDNNFSTSDGGAIFVDGVMTINNGTLIHNNQATTNGGGICIYIHGDVGLEYTTIDYNEAALNNDPEHHGGGIYVYDGGALYLGEYAVVASNDPDNVYYE